MPAHLIDITNVAAAGGTVRFYQPGTLIQANVFSNDAATFILSQPISIDANGKSSSPVYSTTPVRAIFFDSAGAQLLDSERANGERAEITSLVNSRWPLEATVDQALTALAVSLGGNNGNSQASFTGALERSIRARLEDQINVKDFGAKGDGVTFEDTAFSAALSFATTIGKTSVLRVPAGIYLFASPIVTPTGSTNEITIQGDGKGATVLRANGFTASNFLTNGNGLFAMNVRDLTISNSSSSTGIGILATTAISLFFNLDVSGFRTGIKADGRFILVKSTGDGNAAASAFLASDTLNAVLCTITSGGAAGAGIRFPSGKPGNPPNILLCDFLDSGANTPILYEAGNIAPGGLIAGNTFSLNSVAITATAGTRGIPGARVIGSAGFANAILENAASTDIITNPVAGVITLDLSKSRYVKSTLIAATQITFNANSAPFHDDIYTIVLQNSTGGGFAITAGTSTTLQTGGFTVAATSQSVIHMQYDSNASRLIQVTAPVAMAVT